MKGIEGLTLGRYTLRRRVAQGGMAEVYLGYDRRVRRQVAIKVLYGRDESFVRRFEREALAVGTLSHDHILPLYDFGEQRPWYYLVMPYIEGGTLRDYLLKRRRLTLEEAASFINQIASALQYAHDHGVVHRDVKPSNILLRRDGYAYLVDFGLAKAMGAESFTHAGTMLGTPEYMAPEQSNGLHDYRSDIYSLGIILYQMLTGRVPFMADSPVAVSLKHIQTEPTPPRELNSEIPARVEEVILKALAKDPDERYQEARALSFAYWKVLQSEQGRSHADGSALTPVLEVDSDSPGEDGQENAAASGVTKILPETERELLRIHFTPVLFPLIGESEPSHPHPSPYSITEILSRSQRHRPTILALSCLLAISLVLTLALAWQTQFSTRNTLKQRTQSLDVHEEVTNLTATALAQAKIQSALASEARVQATAGITSSIGAGKILYGDTLTDPNGDFSTAASGGWIDDGYQCSFRPDGYHVQTSSPHIAAWCYSSQQQFSNVVITAQAQLLRGDIYGLIFRLSPLNREFYVLEINNSGEYRFVRASGSDPLQWLTLIDWTHSNAILSGYGNLNTFLILATGSQYRFYINQQLIVTNFSDTFYSSGLIGFLVGGDSADGTEAVFSNMWVFQK